MRDDSEVSDLGNDRKWYHQHDREQSKTKGFGEEIEKMMSSIFLRVESKELVGRPRDV